MTVCASLEYMIMHMHVEFRDEVLQHGAKSTDQKAAFDHYIGIESTSYMESFACTVCSHAYFFWPVGISV